MNKKYHMCLSVRGALRNMTRKQLGSTFRYDDGRRLTADEAKEVLLDALASGKEKLPLGDCEGFDYKDGCPGHEAAPDPDEKPVPPMGEEPQIKSEKLTREDSP